MKFNLSGRYVYLLVIALLLLAQPLFAQSLPPVKALSVIKSEQDIRSYRYLILGNQLRVLLVSDPRSEKSAAALNVGVGHYQDPAQLPGLAQLLQHMLTVSAEKYPQAGDYRGFIQQHRGSVSSATAEQDTYYYFDIDNRYFEPALDRFAQFFIAPLFDANFIEQEKHAIDSEHLAQRSDEKLRQRDVFRRLVNSEHPAARSATGNISVLTDVERQSVREHLLEFYKRNYSANLMSLVVMGNHRLDDLQKMVEVRFASIVNNKVAKNSYPPLFAQQTLPLSVAVQSAAGLQELALVFPVGSYADKYTAKPWDYITHLLVNETSGSLVYLLKDLGWVEGLHVEHLFADGQQELLQISLKLTPEGSRAKGQIVSAVFEYIKALSQRGVVDWRFDELKQMAGLEFRFANNTHVSGAIELSRAMQAYPAKDLLWGKYDYSLYDEALIKTALGYLRSDNVIIVDTSAQNNGPEQSADYQVPYSVVPGIAKLMELKPAYRQKLALPGRNVFIPKNVSVKAPSMKFAQGDASTHPGLLLNNNQFILWFLQDQYYRVPRTELNFQVLLPALNNSLENAARVQLFVALAMDQLNDYTHLAANAGSSFNIRSHSRGFDIYLAGYNDRQSLLLDKIASTLAQADFTESRFDAVKKKLLSDWRSQDGAAADKVLIEKISLLQYQPTWELAEYATVLQNTNFDKFKRFSSDVLTGAKIQALFYGNLYAQDAIKLAGLIDYQLLKRKASYPMRASKVLRTENKNGKSWLYPYPASQQALALYIPATSPTINSSAHMLLLNQALQPLFYRRLQDENALTGHVSLQLLPLKNLQASLFMVQSSQSSGEQVTAEIDSFLAAASASINENFADNKLALLTQLRELPLSIEGQAEQFWQSILLNDQSFSRQQEMLLAVGKITPESLLEYYKNTFLQKNRRLWLGDAKFDDKDNFELIENLNKYRQEQAGYLFP